MSDIREPPAPEFTGIEPSYKPAQCPPLTPEAKAKIQKLNEDLRNAFDNWLGEKHG
jgi:hypothetical protein